MYLFGHRWWAHTRVATWPCRSPAGAVLPTAEYGSKRIHRAAQPGAFASCEFFNSLLCLHSLVRASDFGLVFGHLCRPCRMGSRTAYSEPNRSHRCETEGPAMLFASRFLFLGVAVAHHKCRESVPIRSEGDRARTRGGILGKGVRESGTAEF